MQMAIASIVFKRFFLFWEYNIANNDGQVFLIKQCSFWYLEK